MAVKVFIEGRGVTLSLVKGGVQKAITISQQTYSTLTKLLPLVYRSVKKVVREVDLPIGEEVIRVKTLTKTKRVFVDIRLYFFTGEKDKMIPTKQGVCFPLEDTPKLLKDLDKISHEVSQLTERRAKEKTAVMKIINEAWMTKCKLECLGCLNDSPSQEDHFMGCFRLDGCGNSIEEDHGEVRDFLFSMDSKGLAKYCAVGEDRVEEIILDTYSNPQDMC